MKILVTGATGFIGSHLIEALLHKNVSVIASSILSKTEVEADWLNKVDYVQADLNEERENWFVFFDQPDRLIHLAWEGLPHYNDLFHLERNLPSNFAFLKNMVKNGLSDLIISGTCLEYGMQDGVLSEDMDTRPNNAYAIAKDCLRRYLEQLQKHSAFNLKWIRLFYMYGKGQNPKSLLSQLDQALSMNAKQFNMSGGDQLRDYLPVETVAEYIADIALQDKINGIINCCSGTPISVKQLVQDYLLKKGKKIELNLGYYAYNDYEPMAFWGDNSKLKKALDLSNH